VVDLTLPKRVNLAFYLQIRPSKVSAEVDGDVVETKIIFGEIRYHIG